MKAASVSVENQNSVVDKNILLSTGLKYGVTGGIMFILLFLTLYFLDKHPLPAEENAFSAYLINAVIMVVFIFFTLKEVRDYHLRGSLTFAQGMTASFFCYTSLALISAIFVFIFLTYADTALLMKHQQESLVVLMQDPQRWISEVGQQAYDEAIEQVKRQTALDLALDDFFKKVLIGLFLAGIFTLILKK